MVLPSNTRDWRNLLERMSEVKWRSKDEEGAGRTCW
jgi:hypothetical protein